MLFVARGKNEDLLCYSFLFCFLAAIGMLCPPGFAVKGISWREVDKHSQFHTIQFGVEQGSEVAAALTRNSWWRWGAVELLWFILGFSIPWAFL